MPFSAFHLVGSSRHWSRMCSKPRKGMPTTAANNMALLGTYACHKAMWSS